MAIQTVWYIAAPASSKQDKEIENRSLTSKDHSGMHW